jgi:hypothetical protein
LLERELEEATGSLPWKVTEPLRRANKWRHDTVERRRRES